MIDINELRTAVEAAEKSDAESIAMYRKARDERDALRLAVRHEADCVDAAKAEIEALRARIEAMEKQEPVAWARKLGLDVPSFGCVTDLKYRPSNIPESSYIPLYTLPGAQPAPSLASDDVSLISEGKTQPAQSVKDAIIDDLQSQFDTEGITEHNSGDALIRLSDAIAAVEDNFAQPAPSFADAYQGAMEEVAIWKRRALEAEDLNRKFIAKINGPMHMGEPAHPAPSVPNTYAAGINAVAAMLQSKADEYAKEHGHDDMGGLSFGPGMGGEIKMDYYTNLVELVDDVRAMLAAAAPEAKP